MDEISTAKPCLHICIRKKKPRAQQQKLDVIIVKYLTVFLTIITSSAQSNGHYLAQKISTTNLNVQQNFFYNNNNGVLQLRLN